MLAALKTLWRGWKSLIHALNRSFVAALLVATYLFALGPVAVYFWITRRPLIARVPPPGTNRWKPPPPDEDDIRRAQRPW